MPDFPTLGVKFDLSDIVQADRVLLQVQDRLQATGAEVAKFGQENASAARDIKAETVATQGLVSELLLLNRTLRAVELQQKAQSTAARLAGQVGSGATAASQAAANAQLAIDRSLLTSRVGLNRQQMQDADKTAAYLQGVRLRSAANEFADQVRASTAMRRLAEADNNFLTALQNRVARKAPTTADRLAIFEQTAAARGLTTEAAPILSDLAAVQAQRVAAAQATANAELGIDRSLLASRMGLNRQEMQDAERTASYLTGVRLRSTQLEQAAEQRASDATRRLAEADNAFLSALQARVARAAPTTPDRLATYTQVASARGLTAEAAPALGDLTAIQTALAAERTAAAESEVLTKKVAAFWQSLDKMKFSGAQFSEVAGKAKLFEAELLGIGGAAGPAIAALTKIEGSLGHVGGQALKVREAFVLVREFFRGDFSRMAGSASILAGAFGALRPAVLPFTLALLGLVVVIGGVIAAMVKMETENSKLINTLNVTNHAVGLTSDQIITMGKNLAASTDSGVSKAISLLTKLAGTGEVSATSLALVGDASIRLSQLTGEAADKIGADLVKSFDDAAKGAVELNNRYHFLNLAQYEAIDALGKAGDKQGAFNLLMKDLDDHLKTITPEMGFFERQWRGITNAIDETIRSLGNVGKVLPRATQLAQAQSELADLQNPKAHLQSSPDVQRDAAAVQSRIAALQLGMTIDQQFAQGTARQDAKHKAGIDSAITNDAMDKRLKGNEAAIDEAIRDYQINNANRLADNPNDAKALDDQAHMAERIARIRKIMNPPAGRGGNLDATRNQIALGRAQITGLEGQIGAASTNPLTEMAAQVNKAMGDARAKDTFGKKAQFADQQATIAGLKEEATLRLSLVKSLTSQEQAAERLGKQNEIVRKGDDEAFAIMKNLYSGADTNLSTYLNALDKVADAQLRAKAVLNDYNIASQFGVDHVSQISDAYFKAMAATDAFKGATSDDLVELRKHADALQTDAEKALTAANATDTASDADRRAAEARTRLTDALKAYQQQQKALTDLGLQTDLTPMERSAQARVELAATAQILDLRKQFPNLTDQEAQAMVRVKAVMDQQVEDQLKLKQGIQDSIRQTFIDTGKLDFKGLRDGVAKAMRQAVYDSLIAKPITIVVNAVMNIATDAIQSLISKVMGGSGGSGGGGILDSLSSLLGMAKGGYSNGGYSAASTSAMDDLFAQVAGPMGKASSSISSSVSALSSMLSLAGPAFAGSQIGSAGASALFGTKSNTGSMVGGAIGGVGGFLLGSAMGIGTAMTGTAILGLAGAALGPIGMVVGAILGAALGSLIGPKPSNFTASGTANGAGGFTYGGDKPNDQTTQLATALGSAITASMQSLVGTGITPTQSVTGFNIGQRDPTRVMLSGGATLETAVGDPAAAANSAMLELLKTANYANDAEKTFVLGLIATGAAFDSIATSLKNYEAAQSFYNSIDRSILQYTDPQAYALKNLQDQQIARRKQVQSYATQGLLTPDQVAQLSDKLKVLEKLEITDTLSQFVTGLNGATASLQDFKDAQTKLLDYANGLKVGALSPLSPTAQLAQAGNDFFAQVNKARGGDLTALQNINQPSDTYLQQAQSVYGGTAGYAAIFDTVQAALAQLGTQDFATSTGGTGVDSAAVTAAVADLQTAIEANFAQLIGTVSTANDNGATSTDIANLQTAVVDGLAAVAAALGAQTEAVVASQAAGLGSVAGAVQTAVGNQNAFAGGFVQVYA